MFHIHHIIPKHMGGTDDPENLTTLTIEEHADAHKNLFDLYGKQEDYIAWMSLTTQIGREEIFKQTSSLGGKGNKGNPKSKEHREKISKSIKSKYKKHGDEVKKKISTSMIGNKNSKNHSSDEYKIKQSQAMKEAWRRKKLSSRSVGRSADC